MERSGSDNKTSRSWAGREGMAPRSTEEMVMEKVKAWINVDRSLAVLAGKTEFGQKLVDVDVADLSGEHRATLAKVSVTSPSSQQPNGFWLMGNAVDNLGVVDESMDSIRMLLDAASKVSARVEADKKEKFEKGVAAYLAAPVEKLVRTCRGSVDNRTIPSNLEFWEVSRDINYTLNIYNTDVAASVLADPRISEKMAEVEKACAIHNTEVSEQAREMFREYDERRRMIDEKEAREATEKAAAEDRREAQLDAWVAENGSDNQQKRHEIGLLPEEEILDAIRSAAFASLDNFARYEKLRKQDIDCICEHEGPKASFDVTPATKATAEEFELMEKIGSAIKGNHPAAELTLLDHSAWCENCYGKDDDGNETERDIRTVYRKSVRVKIQIGELTFSREYAI